MRNDKKLLMYSVKLMMYSVAILAMMGSVVSTASGADNLSSWSIKENTDGTISIAEYLGEERIVAIPRKLEGLLVTCIQKDAFCGKESVEEVTIPEGVIKVEEGAFRDCENLRKVILPKSAEIVEEGAFYNTDIKAYEVKKGNQSYGTIGGVLFALKSKTLLSYPPGKKTKEKYNVPKGVERLGKYAFAYCKNVHEVVLHKNIKEIGDYAFFLTDLHKSLKIPSSVTYISDKIYGDSGDGKGDAVSSQIASDEEAGSMDVLDEDESEDTPFEQQYWIIFREGYRGNRVEASTIDSPLDADDLSFVWHKSIELSDKTDSSDCNQYFYSEGEWEWMRTASLITAWATQVIASNLDVVDKDGNIVLEKTTYEEWLRSSEE